MHWLADLVLHLIRIELIANFLSHLLCCLTFHGVKPWNIPMNVPICKLVQLFSDGII